MLGWDRRLEGWIVATASACSTRSRGTSTSGWAAVWLAIAVGSPSLARRGGRCCWTRCSAAVVALLTTDGASRPTTSARPARDVDTLVSRPHTGSFPSGHAATSFASATVLAAFVPRLRVPLYVLAALIARSRAYVGVHYPLDAAGRRASGRARRLARASELFDGSQQAADDHAQRRQQADPDPDPAAVGGEHVVRDRDHADQDEAPSRARRARGSRGSRAATRAARSRTRAGSRSRASRSR